MAETVSTRRAQTRERLVAAGFQAFAKSGVQAASVEEICELAGFTRGAFYSNFESKDDLCLAVLQDLGDRVLAAVNPALDEVIQRIDDPDVDRLIDDALNIINTAHPSDPVSLLARQELRLYSLRNPAIRAAVVAAEDRLHRILAEALAGAVAERGGRTRLPVDQILILLDCFLERSALDELQRDTTTTPAKRGPELARLLRALIELPQDRP